MKQIILFISLLLSIASLQAKNVLIVGDSLSAGYGIDPKKGWVELLNQRIKSKGYQTINLSTSGDTSSNGLTKLKKGLKQYQPVVVIIQLGANDGLRGLSIKALKQNLNAMIKMSQANHAKVLLLATRLPPNYGKAYIKQFRQSYVDLAKKYQIPLVPAFLKGIAARPNYLQQDRLHPNASAQPIIFNNIWPQLKPLLP